MREKKTFAQRTRTRNTDEVRKKYFLVYEGKETEEIYFEGVNQNRSMIGINPLIELVLVTFPAIALLFYIFGKYLISAG